METTFIYALCEPGTRTVRYIGKANDPKRRFRQHLRKSIKMDSHLGNWLRGIQSDGENPNLVILSEITLDQWELEEMRFIQSARMLGMRLVNATDGGEGTNNPSLETRAKLSEAGKRKTGEKNHRFGTKHTPESRAKMSASQIGEKNHNFGKKLSIERCAQISASATGKTHTPEAKTRMSVAHSGEKNPMFGRAGEASPCFGKKHTPEHRAKNRAAHVGRKDSPETLVKKSAAMTGDKNPMSAVNILRRAREKAAQHE